MTATKGVGLGFGAIVAGAVASCPIVQGAVLGALAEYSVLRRRHARRA